MPRKKVTIGKRSLALDARPDRLDLRDRRFTPQLGSLPERWPSDSDAARWLPEYSKAGLIRNQGEDGACTGFGLAAVIDYLSFVNAAEREDGKTTAVRRASPAMLYELAKLYDEWPGEDYEGSSCRGALKGWHRHGVCRDELWPYVLNDDGKRVFTRPKEDADRRDDPKRNWDVDALGCTIGVYYRIDASSIVDMQAAIHQVGAIYCSATVHEGWDLPDGKIKTPSGHAALPVIEHVPSPKDPGGHAFALVGYDPIGFVVQNSWGDRWGAGGFAILPYADWVTHGDDAWVFTLGMPAGRSMTAARGKGAPRSPRHLVPMADQDAVDTMQRPIGLVGAGDAFERRYRAVPSEVQPLDADSAYRHALVLDRGFPVRNDFTVPDATASVARVGFEWPSAWLKENGARKVLVYAHGGLNSESDSIARVRAIAPYALANGIYPIFVTWRTGTLETLSDLGEEMLAKLGLGARGAAPVTGWVDRLSDRTDRLLEPVLRGPGGALWQQMKLNAVRASADEQGGCALLVQQLAALKKAQKGLEIHFVGHSAGSILIGQMLTRIRKLGAGLRADSVRLLAPACTTRFALDHYKPAIENDVLAKERFHIHTLSNANELDDSVGPYRKSLLYLVSRAFEDAHKMPILGLEKAFDDEAVAKEAADDTFAGSELDEAREWLDFWKDLDIDATNRRPHVLRASHVSTGARSIPSSHGCFDNAVDIVGRALGYVVDPDDPAKVTVKRLEY